MITKIEEEILITVWRFKGKGYGVNIFQHLESIKEKKITLGVVYDTLERLRNNGYVDTYLGEPTPARGGMRKKFYETTEMGIEVLIKSKETHDKIMEGFGALVRRHLKMNTKKI